MGMAGRMYRQIGATFTTFWPIVGWIVINYFIFKKHYYKYKNAPEHYYLRTMIGRGLCISRATAAMLNFSCCILLLPLCRSLNLLLHHLLGLLSQSALMYWIKNARKFHIMCASTVIVECALHTGAHCANALNFSLHYNEKYSSLNWAKYSGQPAIEIIFSSVAGVTGFFMIVILFVMSSTSLKYTREKYYQVFWFTHHSYLLFLILLLCHPMSGELKQLADSPNITNCFKNIQNISIVHEFPTLRSSMCGNKAEFVAMKSETWIWIMPPFILLLMDRIFWSLKRNWKQLGVLQVTRLPGSVIHLVLQSPFPNFFCRPGQYVLLQCPVISRTEWHPFSVVAFSASEQSSLSVLIRAKGDWTENLLGRILVPFSHQHYDSEIYNKSSGKPVKFLVDGPFRSPLEEVLNTPIAVCIAAGVGITPFISIFNYLLATSDQKIPKRLHLLWLLRDPKQLSWCAELLCELHEKFWQENIPDRFIIQVHITKDYNVVDLQNALSHECKLLLQRIRKGRPIWQEFFSQIKEMYSGQSIHIFTSGPKVLVSEINLQCKKIKKEGFTIRYSHETF